MKKLIQQISALEGDELEVVKMIVDRMSQGRKVYGPWCVDDGRDYLDETLQEMLDGANYLAAELVRLKRSKEATSEFPVRTWTRVESDDRYWAFSLSTQRPDWNYNDFEAQFPKGPGCACPAHNRCECLSPLWHSCFYDSVIDDDYSDALYLYNEDAEEEFGTRGF